MLSTSHILTHFTIITMQNSGIIIIIPILQMRKLRHSFPLPFSSRVQLSITLAIYIAVITIWGGYINLNFILTIYIIIY